MLYLKVIFKNNEEGKYLIKHIPSIVSVDDYDEISNPFTLDVTKDNFEICMGIE